MLSIGFRVIGSSVVDSLLIDLAAAYSKLVVSNLRLLLVGSSSKVDYKAIVASSFKVVEETITSSYSKGLLLYYKKSSLV